MLKCTVANHKRNTCCKTVTPLGNEIPDSRIMAPKTIEQQVWCSSSSSTKGDHPSHWSISAPTKLALPVAVTCISHYGMVNLESQWRYKPGIEHTTYLFLDIISGHNVPALVQQTLVVTAVKRWKSSLAIICQLQFHSSPAGPQDSDIMLYNTRFYHIMIHFLFSLFYPANGYISRNSCALVVSDRSVGVPLFLIECWSKQTICPQVCLPARASIDSTKH